ncbi:MAG TPA: HAMP domain-containing sensor histidine kinase, partial [Pirellulales bacterium]
MRQPIRRQLLLPFLSVVVAAMATTSGLNAYRNSAWTRTQQEQQLDRLSETFLHARFPLNRTVLETMHGLSGAQFVLLDADGRTRAATLAPGKADLALLPVRKATDRADGRVVPDHTIEVAGEWHVARRVAVPTWNDPRGASLVILDPESPRRAETWAAAVPPLVVGAAAAGIVALTSTVLARRFAARIHTLERRASAIAAGDFSPVEVDLRDDEIRDLTLSLNRMAEQLAASEQKVRSSERLRTLGQLGGGIAHQLRNSATGAQLALDLHRRECPLGAHDEALEVIQRQLELMRSYLQRFLSVGRRTLGERRAVRLDELLRETLPLLKPQADHMRTAVELVSPPDLPPIEGDADMLRQLVVNLVMNAIEAAGAAPGSPGWVRATLSTPAPGRVAFQVSDSGPGPAKHVREKLFEAFVSEKPDGAGLGLSVSRQIAEEHNGSLVWDSTAPHTTFSAEFPAYSSAASSGASPTPDQRPFPGLAE